MRRGDAAIGQLFPLLLLGAIVLGIVAFGVISWSASFYVAAAYALFFVGVALMLVPAGPTFLGVGFVVGGIVLHLAADSLPALTLGQALSFMGGSP